MSNISKRLIFVAFCDFRRSELSNYLTAIKKYRKLESGEVMLFISFSKNQLIWILKDTTINGIKMIDSRRWRLDSHSTWNPIMITNYARKVGITLLGLKEFEDYIKSKRG